MSEHPRIVQTVIDAEDVRAVAEFYRELFGLEYRPGDEPGDGPDDLEWLVLRDPAGGHQLAFQQTDRLPTTTWPDPEVPMQLHIDCTVPDLDALERHRSRAEALGARLVLDRSDDPDEPLYVLADPAGHPFCLFVG
jgi:catechol 2,3-dioxygenase-like lactoylglutathione lyase family enzyme